MINVTAQAAQRLTADRRERGLGHEAGVRLLPMASGVGMIVLPGPKEGDAIETVRGIRFFIAPDVISKLKGATLDVARRRGIADLVFRVPRRAGVASAA
jgi:hypothetical protein